ncbi:MAG: DUF357 domain-containing protein [Candidatus Micrarchaeia archaeon]
MEGVEGRIKKDIDIFYRNVKFDTELSEDEKKVVELAEMYAKDSQTWLEKGDLYTAFSSISYAHGLLDAIRKIKGVDEYK